MSPGSVSENGPSGTTTAPGVKMRIADGAASSKASRPAESHTLRANEATPTRDAAARRGHADERDQHPDGVHEARRHGEEHQRQQLHARVQALQQTRPRGDLLVLQHVRHRGRDGVRGLAGERTPAALRLRRSPERAATPTRGDSPLLASSAPTPKATPTVSAVPTTAAMR